MVTMSEILILCGLMGCGKTTFVKELNEKLDYGYIDFDLEYHKEIQKEHLINPIEDIPMFLGKIIKLLNDNPDKNFTCDNWFKWHKDWWKDKTDNTLNVLKEKLKYHEIRLIMLEINFKEAYKRYIEKHKKEGTLIQENYIETVEERQKNLNEKILK